MYLNCHSYHSLRYGTIPTADLVAMAKEHGIPALALTDINAVAGVYDFVRLCRDAGIRPIAGIEFRDNGVLKFIGLAHSQAGLAEMNRFLTNHNFSGESLPDRAPNFDEVVIIYPLQVITDLQDNEFIGIRPDELNFLYRDELKVLIPHMIILQPVTYRNKREYNLHKILRAIDLNVIGSRLKQGDICSKGDVMISHSELLKKYEFYPEIIENTQALVDRCDFEFEFHIPRNKRYFTGDKAKDLKLLTQLAYQGLVKRYPQNDAEAHRRVEKELKVINDLEFAGYFLITWDIVRYSGSKGFMHVGRGSGANSIISYCLGITDVCPIELNLYFERFLNANRKSPPDFDIDWSWKERDTILEYIFDKYGRDHVAFCGTNVEFKYRSIIREVGKVFGLPKEELDELAKRTAPKDDKNEVVNLVHKYGKLLEKFPNQRSMHSCGILISEDPITNYSILEMPPKGFPIVQFDMHVAEDIGFDKFDILSQRGLGTIEEAVSIIKQNHGVNIDIRNTSLTTDNAECNLQLAIGNTLGCFYIESPAMRGLLRRLKCSDYRTLVAASSIIRPGVAQSGMMREYIFRHNFPGQFEYLHEVLQEHLSETYGIMVYQEDVIKIAIYYGGLSAADGDILRRAMSGKGRSPQAMQRVRDNFFLACKINGRPEKLSEEIYRQIESFAGYSFCKAHSASYAVESYQSLYLKVKYPVDFMVAAINNGGGFYRTEVYVHEAKMSGGIIHNPCVNHSDVLATIYGKDVYLGFAHLKSLPNGVANHILIERQKNGVYKSMEDFIDRIPIGIETIQILIFIGAFRFTGKSKNELMIKARLILVNFKPETWAPKLLQEPVKDYVLPHLERSLFEDAFDEIELLSFPVSHSPFDLLKTQYRGDVMAVDLLDHYKKEVKMLAYLISRKHVPTKRGDMFFGTWIDANGNYFDTAHFSDSLAAFPFKGGGCYRLFGVVEVDHHFPTVTISKMEKMPFVDDPRYSIADERRLEAQRNIREDVSMTHRAPYPQEQEIGLPRHKF